MAKKGIRPDVAVIPQMVFRVCLSVSTDKKTIFCKNVKCLNSFSLELSLSFRNFVATKIYEHGQLRIPQCPAPRRHPGGQHRPPESLRFTANHLQRLGFPRERCRARDSEDRHDLNNNPVRFQFTNGSVTKRQEICEMRPRPALHGMPKGGQVMLQFK